MGKRDPRRRHVVGGALAVLLALALLAASVVDLQIHRHLSAATGTLRRTRSEVSLTVQRVRDTRVMVAQTVARRKDLQAALGSVSTELLQAQGKLQQADAAQAFLGASIATINDCVDGVQQTLTQIDAGQQSAAVQSISGVSSACLSLVDGGGPGGPAYPFDFPDPDIVRVGSTYFAYGTNSAEGSVQILQSTDLVHWSAVGNALPSVPTWASPGSTWSPAVIQLGADYVLYYTVKVAASGQECISDAVAADPKGPFVDSTTGPLVCQAALGGSIDPDPFIGADGQPYLVWRAEGTATQAPGLWSEQLSPTGTALAPPPPAPPATPPDPAAAAGASLLLEPTQAWEAGVAEGPAMVYTDGAYYLFFSANNWNSANYVIGVALCQGPLGPCNPFPSEPLLASGPQFAGPGGPTVFSDASGTLWLGFHAWLPGQVGYPYSRLLYLRRLTISGTSVQVGGPP